MHSPVVRILCSYSQFPVGEGLFLTKIYFPFFTCKSNKKYNIPPTPIPHPSSCCWKTLYLKAQALCPFIELDLLFPPIHCVRFLSFGCPVCQLCAGRKQPKCWFPGALVMGSWFLHSICMSIFHLLVLLSKPNPFPQILRSETVVTQGPAGFPHSSLLYCISVFCMVVTGSCQGNVHEKVEWMWALLVVRFVCVLCHCEMRKLEVPLQHLWGLFELKQKFLVPFASLFFKGTPADVVATERAFKKGPKSDSNRFL